MDLGFELITTYGYLAIFLLLMLGIVGLPVPDETLLVFVGYLGSKGTLALGPTWAAAFLGSVCGITLSYGLGRAIGPRLIATHRSYLHLQQKHLAVAEQWFHGWGKYALVLCYFVPGVRHFAALIAGSSQLSFGVFGRFAYLGALIWSSTFIGLGYSLGEEWKRVPPLMHSTMVIGAILILLSLVIGIVLLHRRSETS